MRYNFDFFMVFRVLLLLEFLEKNLSLYFLSIRDNSAIVKMIYHSNQSRLPLALQLLRSAKLSVCSLHSTQLRYEMHLS